ncbi:29.3 kDa [Spodoptera frugiperda ascovirus 1a]|uniref:29.3 kDa n=1 Tax=Spodoptera frugiperda ascovirus 1a TaxID=113370 RepID=Q0E544_SFAVA|nr:29.3 kDa [Spodoptera frugiperda ascovirus 1a]CAL44657.1 29.3 kDa [Spodoptera frugiperda ascovirus 1a]
MDYLIELWQSEAMNVANRDTVHDNDNINKDDINKDDDGRCMRRRRVAVYQKQLSTYDTSHEVKVFAMNLFNKLSLKKSVGDRRLPRQILMAACVCCAQCHHSAPNNKARVAKHFGNINPKHLRRAILAVKREDPSVRTRFKTDTDRLTELCDSLGINEYIDSVLEYYRRTCKLLPPSSVHRNTASPRTRCAAYIYVWFKNTHACRNVKLPGLAGFCKACHVSPNGFNMTVQALLNVPPSYPVSAGDKTLARCSCSRP